MPAHTVADVPPAPTPPPRGTWRSRFLLAGAAVLLLIILLVGFEVGIGLVMPDAVQANASLAFGGRTLATRRISDAHTVADLYAHIEALPSTGGLHFSCMLASPDPVRYRFHFTRWGPPVEDATLPGTDCRGVVDQPRRPLRRAR